MAEMGRPEELAAIEEATGRVQVVIETPAHSRCKFKFDEQRGLFQLSKLLPAGAAFPHAVGFIPSTLGEDGDPLDVLVLLEDPLFAGCVTTVRLIGVLEAEQTERGKSVRNDRLMAVVETDLNPAELSSLADMGPSRLKEIEHFFVSYHEAEGRKFRPIGRSGPERAAQLLEEGRQRYAKNHVPPSSNGTGSQGTELDGTVSDSNGLNGNASPAEPMPRDMAQPRDSQQQDPSPPADPPDTPAPLQQQPTVTDAPVTQAPLQHAPVQHALLQQQAEQPPADPPPTDPRGEQPDQQAARRPKPEKSSANPQQKKSNQLRPDESFRKGIKRIVRRQLERVRTEAKRFGTVGATPDVHDIRKRCKRLRAVLRLVRSELGEEAYRRENSAIRDAGRFLSDVRNSRVLLDTLSALKDRSRNVPRESFDVVGRFLRARQWDARDQLARNEAGVESLQQTVYEMRQRAKDWLLPHAPRRTVRRSLKRAYKQTAQAFQTAELIPTDEHLHECRKQAKYLSYQLQTIERVGRSSLKDLQQAAHDLEHALGEDHDLALLRHEVLVCQNGGLIADADSLLGLIDERRRDVQRQTLLRARPFFGPPGDAVRKKLAAWPKQAAKD